jgi:hypothetical protein
MPYPEPERYIPLQLRLLASHPALLEGLDIWLKLGLINDREVQILCQRYLVSDLPEQHRLEQQIVPSTSLRQVSNAALQQQSVEEAAIASSPASITPPSSPLPQRQSQSWVNQFLQSLINEVSVIWLLCLGVFLVVTSSAVLAANQWNNLSPPGQYGILLTYTLAFIGASFWTATKPQLQITARMLQVTSLLLIPVNFWMMDGFQLLQSTGGILVAILAALLLSVAIAILLPQRHWIAANVLGLSWLHWGWGWYPVPVIATYIGCIGTSAALLLGQRQTEPLQAQITPWWSRISAADIVLPFAVMLLLFRASVVAAVSLEQLGLAFGICGWLLCWQTRFQPSQRIWALCGLALLLIGWMISLPAQIPWQALLVGGLGLWLLGDRLLRYRNSSDLIGIFVVGLASFSTLVRLTPPAWREAYVATWINWVGSQGMPEALWGIGLFPYLWGCIGLTFYLRRAQQHPLVRLAYILSGILGICAVGVSTSNPGVRSLSLWLALLTVGMALRQHSSRPMGVYVTHLLGLAAVFSTVNAIAPALTISQWGLLILGIMLIEWVALLLIRQPLWQESTWYIGLALAVLGYVLLVSAFDATPATQRSVALIIPTALTILPFFAQFRWREAETGLSVASIIVVQFLTFDAVIPRLAGLALGMLLMALNTARNPHLLTAVLSVGFGITFGYCVGWEVLPQQFQNWIMLSVGLLWSAVSLRHVFACRAWRVSRPFEQALDGWAIAIATWTSIPLAIISLLVTKDASQWIKPEIWVYPTSSLLMTTALMYRYWQASAQSWLVGIAWTTEVFLLCALKYYWQLPMYSVAIATIALGLLSAILGEVWVRRTGQAYRWGYNLIPLGYGFLGWFLGHTDWTATTGLYTLALAMIGVSIGRRLYALMPISILGILSFSLGCFELLLYPLLKAQGGQPGDGFVILSALALALAMMYRLSDRWVTQSLRLLPQSLTVLGHVHWGVATLLALIALPQLSSTGELIWSGELLLLGGYALWQGRQQSPWIYAGVLQVLMALGQTLYTHLPSAQVLPGAGAMASAVALFLYSLPWQRWGWVQLPFTHAAIVLPATVGLLSVAQVNTSSLLLIGGFYGWIAFVTQFTRLSYIGMPAVNWAALKLLRELQLTSAIWSVGLVGLSLLFIAQIDPAFQPKGRREIRHLLRCFAVGLVSVTALYESDTQFWSGILTVGLGLGLVLLGLLLRVRAFLYVGTLTFVFKVLRLVWLFVAHESQTLWVAGFIPGILFIWIAMTFEARRSQVTALLQYWVTALEEWQ